METNVEGTHHKHKHKHGHGLFQPGSVRVIDYDKTNNNILVRGSSAFGAENFTGIAALTVAITADKNFAGTGITLGANPLVIDFCLIGFGAGSKDSKIVDAETTWFTSTLPTLNGGSGPYPTYVPSTITANPGTMVYWPILSIGGTVPTTANGAWQNSYEHSIGGTTSNGFDYKGLIPAIKAALTNTMTQILNIKNAIIYIHCDSGVNRTGAAVVGYLMTYGSNLSLFKLKSQPATATPYALSATQTAANLAPPSDDSHIPGGGDIPVAEAYCNFLSTNGYQSPLAANCVPLTNEP